MAPLTAALRSEQRGSIALRLLVILAVVGGIAALFLYAGGWFTPHRLTPGKIINAFEQANGEHPGFRRNHAKGVGVSGYFESNGKGAAYSRAVVFQPGQVPVLGRFALAGGQPYQADAAGTVRSLALLFQLPDGEEWRTGMNNIPVFPVRTAQGFYDQLHASVPDPKTGKPDPEKMKAFLAAHPEAAAALQLIRTRQISSGFADSTYNALNAFYFINATGKSVPVRWSLVPVQPFAPVDAAKLAAQGTNYLFDTLIAGIHAHPLQWRLVVTLGQPGDPTADATLPWPASREQVEVGTVTLDHVESEATSPVRDINFDPLVLPAGIAGSDDPLLSARSAAYARSFTRRESESKAPSAVTPAETGK